MNKKVFISMLTLSAIFLVGLYVFKIFFPQEFMMSIQSEKIIAIGTFIDSHEWLYYLCCGLTSFLTYWLYCCACSGRLYLKWYEVLEIVGVIVICRAVNFYDTTLATAISLCSFLFLPAIMKGDLKKTAIIYTTHTICQALSLGIRSLPIYLTSVNFITMFIFGIESYLWLILFYIIFNYKKEK